MIDVRKSITNECCYTCEHWKSLNEYNNKCQIIANDKIDEVYLNAYTDPHEVCDLYELRK